MDRHGLQGGGGAVQESNHGGGAGQAELVVDGAFLMELLEDTPASAAGEQQLMKEDDDADDRLSRVMRSLEAEIGGGGATLTPVEFGGDGASMGVVPANGVGGGLELDDVLSLSVSDLDGSSRGSCSAEATPPLAGLQSSFEYWARAELPPAVGHDMGGWCVDGDGVAVAGYEFREPCYYTYYSYNESSHVEQAYSPLWEIGNE